MKEYLVKQLRQRSTLEEMTTKKDVKEQIREISDLDDCFENLVFELGCSVLAKAYVKRYGKGE